MIKNRILFFLLFLISMCCLCLRVYANSENNYRATGIGNQEKPITEKQSSNANYIDISGGWTNIQYNSDIQPDVDKVFLQNQEIVGNQKGVLVQAGNLGDSSFKAQKVIPMKKGFKYDLDLIYAQYYNLQGQGYIDFNGDKITSNDDHTDHHYKKTIIPEKDMNYIITVSFTTVYRENAYFKIAYDKSNGGISVKQPQNVIVNYLDNDKTKISNSDVLHGGFGDTYITSPKKIAGYTFKEVVGHSKGIFTDEPQIVNYIYSKDELSSGNVEVRYVDTEGNAISSPENLIGKIGDSYTTNKKEIAGYTFKEVLGDYKGKFTKETQIVSYVYNKDELMSGNVEVKYVDTEGNIISSPENLIGKIGDSYTTNKKKIKGYTFKEVIGNQKGKFTEKNETVRYIYSRKLISNTHLGQENKKRISDKELLPKTGENERRSVINFIIGILLLVFILIGLLLKHSRGKDDTDI